MQPAQEFYLHTPKNSLLLIKKTMDKTLREVIKSALVAYHSRLKQNGSITVLQRNRYSRRRGTIKTCHTGTINFQLSISPHRAQQ